MKLSILGSSPKRVGKNIAAVGLEPLVSYGETQVRLNVCSKSPIGAGSSSSGRKPRGEEGEVDPLSPTCCYGDRVQKDLAQGLGFILRAGQKATFPVRCYRS